MSVPCKRRPRSSDKLHSSTFPWKMLDGDFLKWIFSSSEYWGQIFLLYCHNNNIFIYCSCAWLFDCTMCSTMFLIQLLNKNRGKIILHTRIIHEKITENPVSVYNLKKHTTQDCGTTLYKVQLLCCCFCKCTTFTITDFHEHYFSDAHPKFQVKTFLPTNCSLKQSNKIVWLLMAKNMNVVILHPPCLCVCVMSEAIVM